MRMCTVKFLGVPAGGHFIARPQAVALILRDPIRKIPEKYGETSLTTTSLPFMNEV